MKRYVIRRLLWLFPILFLISFLSFSLMHLSPRDPAVIYLSQGGSAPSDEAVNQLREQLGLNLPFWTQYGHWLAGILRGDLGTSIFTGNPVSQEIVTYFPNTLRLAALSLALTLLVSIPLGVLAAVKENRWLDLLIRFCTFVAGSLPGFLAAMLLIYLLGVQLRWFPTISSGSSQGIWIPAFTLALCLSAGYIRQVRAAVIQECGEEYVRLKRARGIRERTILFRDALRSALPAILALAGLNAGTLLGGSAIIEVVCTYPGLGRLAVQAITNRDYPLMQGYVLLMAVLYVLINLAVDLLHAWADPRVQKRLIQEEYHGVSNRKKEKKKGHS